MTIFNRWGGEVYTSNDSIGWGWHDHCKEAMAHCLPNLVYAEDGVKVKRKKCKSIGSSLSL